MTNTGFRLSPPTTPAGAVVHGNRISLQGDVFHYQDSIRDTVSPDLCSVSSWLSEPRRGVRMADVTFRPTRDVEFEFLDMRQLSLTLIMDTGCRGGVRGTPVHFEARTGDMFLISPSQHGQRNPFLAFDSGKRYQMLSFSFDHGLFESLIEDLRITLPSTLQGRLYVPETLLLDRRTVHSKVGSLFAEIRSFRHGGIARELFMQSKASELLIEYCLVLKAGLPRRRELSRTHQQKVQEAKAIILSKLNRAITTRELARMVGVNECTLKRAFREVHGVSVHAFQTEARLQHARTQLMSSDARVAEIAYDLGFAHQSHFTAVFRKRFGMPPKTFQRRYGGTRAPDALATQTGG